MSTSQNKVSDAFKITGNWTLQSKRLQEKFSQLTDDDLKLEIGKEEQLLTKVATRINKGRNEVINIINKTQRETT
ncbi:CsbD family protein [Polluticaenibacter yanchengensis]|uniref:General stress protein CsbD n=1 Tax=Polluticaenibacter yanchengensis TaxID=3014562 RepID=A0ABT4UFB1_9BACT|nr:general stress protein CsbD [Chitinophagaceae bacterium LY-5]